ncbi:ATP-dependent RNA helicase dbp4, partial [Teratosphaeriaceae sp. CCFEE 6253]
GGGDAWADFVADAKAAEDGEEGVGDGDGDEEEQRRPSKKAKKWFQRDVVSRDDEGRGDGEGMEIGTFDQLEAEAARLLG